MHRFILIGAWLLFGLFTIGAGVLIGAEGRPMLSAMGIERLDEAPRLRLAEVTDIGFLRLRPGCLRSRASIT